jgi:hypothetical protein
MLTGVLKLPGWQLPVVFAGLILVISGPSMVIAWLKLRKRNLGPILDANGWAVNARAKVNLPFGASLTRVATLPPGSSRDFSDPYAETHKGRNRFITLLIVAAVSWASWNFGLVERVAPGKLPKSKWLQNREAQATTASQPASLPASSTPAK